MTNPRTGDRANGFPLLTLPGSGEDIRIAVIGLGYVGAPLAAALGRCYDTCGFDLKPQRIEELNAGLDSTGETSAEDLKSATRLRLSHEVSDLKDRNVFIVAVPTPIDSSWRPNLAALIAASRMVGQAIRPGGVVIYESTVYPGATEEECIPVIEQASGLQYNRDFFAGYSPERINPGDKSRPLSDIVKVTSGSTSEIAAFVDGLYASIIRAGTYRASSIRVAEAAKIIENTQRDVNIALINELSIIFSHLGIDTNEVLEAAATKWNFVKLKPGLVGGHCIGVDPYYLLHKSMSAGYIPDIIRRARQINDDMARNAASRLIKALIHKSQPIKGGKVLIVGFAFKENCPDTRNTKVADLVHHLEDYGMRVEVADSRVDREDVARQYGLDIRTSLPETNGVYQAVVLAVPHDDMVSQAHRLKALLAPEGLLFDMKAALPIEDSDLRL